MPQINLNNPLSSSKITKAQIVYPMPIYVPLEALSLIPNKMSQKISSNTKRMFWRRVVKWYILG